MFVAMVTNWLTYLLKLVKMAAAHEQKKQNVTKKSRQWTTTENFDASVLRSVISSLIKKEDNPLSKSAFL